MKNIHVLPTDNYSPLVHSTSKYGGYFLSKYYSPMKHMGDSFQHIYITNDEVIKQGDWCIYHSGEVIQYLVKLNTDNLKKIILTTDQDLIKDGVQAIDDEFLESFVKNPSCEFVEIVKCSGYLHLSYMIIIPQEEPKQETLEEVEKNIDREEWINFFKNNTKEEILEYLINYKFPL
jgi:hypothetical protein